MSMADCKGPVIILYNTDLGRNIIENIPNAKYITTNYYYIIFITIFKNTNTTNDRKIFWFYYLVC